MNIKNDGKEKYNSIEIPNELNDIITKSINSNEYTKPKNKTLISIVSTIAALFIFTLSLNVSETFAQSISDFPIVGQIAKVLTFREYSYETENIKADVNIPQVEDLNDKQIQDKINKLISDTIDDNLIQAEIRADEYKKAFIETGGTKEEYEERKIETVIDYEIKSQSRNILSFLVFSYDTLAAAYAEYYYYNINLNNDKIITLTDLLGENYNSIITKNVKESMEIMKENEDISFNDNLNSDEWTIRDDIDFFINENENIVVVFNKYEIAAGYLGRLEFEIISE